MATKNAKKKTVNPHCPVTGCKTQKSHTDDTVVNGLVREFRDFGKLAKYSCAAMAELANSICRDLAEKKYFAFQTRLRQPEELYIRTLYTIFIAADDEIPHIMSNEMPNGFGKMYEKVNELVFESRGLLQTGRLGLNLESFKPMDLLNDGAHVSFRAFLTTISVATYPEYLPSVEKYAAHLNTYCRYLDHVGKLFATGRSKEVALGALINMHRPASYWQNKAD